MDRLITELSADLCVGHGKEKKGDFIRLLEAGSPGSSALIR